MKTSTNAIVAIISIFCFVTIKAVEVYTAGPDGKPAWRESSEMRDRSNVPTPSTEDIEADSRRRSKVPVPVEFKYRTRSEIPVPITSNYRHRTSSIPRPSTEDIVKDYVRRRSRIPSHGNLINRGINALHRRTASRRKAAVEKKNIIDRIFFTLPFGAQFPLYFTSPHSKKGSRTNKKSHVVLPMRRHRLPFKPRYSVQAWGLPVNYKALENKKLVKSYIGQEARNRQQIIPLQDGFPSLQSTVVKRYYPRYFYRTQLLANRKSAPHLIQRNRQYAVPRSRYFLNRITRSNNSILKKSKLIEEEEENRAVINREFS